MSAGDNVKLVALIKTFSGEDWVEPCVRAIYQHVEKIVFVHSNISWTGQLGNTVEPVVRKKMIPWDFENKIVNLTLDTRKQNEQLEYGMRFIKDRFPWANFVMQVDTDEIWNAEDIQNCKYTLATVPTNAEGFVTNMRSYIKSPFFRINHLDALTPMIFLKNNGVIKGHRGMNADPVYHIENATMHHFCFVRRRFELVIEKLLNSHRVEGQKHLPLDYWIERVWINLPDKVSKCEGLHPAIGYQNNWMGVERISRAELPDVLREIDYEIIMMNLDDAAPDPIDHDMDY